MTIGRKDTLITSRSAAQQRMVPMQGVSNCRDLGGYTGKDGRLVKWGMLYRSAELSELSEQDMKQLHAIGIRTICDLRDRDEISAMPTPALSAVTNINIPLIPADNGPVVRQAYDLGDTSKRAHLDRFGPPDQLLVHLNQAMIQSTQALQAIFKLLLQDHSMPFLFHCTAGKDRTGLIAALILMALGVSKETIMQDYLLTNQYLDTAKIAAKSRSTMQAQADVPEEIMQDIMKAVMEARPEYLNAALDQMLEQYEDIEHYLTQAIGLSAEEIVKLQNKLLS